MGLTDDFKNAVKSKDIIMVRIIMKNSMILDKSFNTLNKMQDYAKNLDGLYEEYDKKPFLSEELWVKENIDKTLVELMNNFSIERLEYTKKFMAKVNPSNLQKNKTKNKNESNLNYIKSIVLSIIGAVFGLLLGIIIGVKAFVYILFILIFAVIGFSISLII